MKIKRSINFTLSFMNSRDISISESEKISESTTKIMIHPTSQNGGAVLHILYWSWPKHNWDWVFPYFYRVVASPTITVGLWLRQQSSLASLYSFSELLSVILPILFKKYIQ